MLLVKTRKQCAPHSSSVLHLFFKEHRLYFEYRIQNNNIHSITCAIISWMHQSFMETT